MAWSPEPPNKELSKFWVAATLIAILALAALIKDNIGAYLP